MVKMIQYSVLLVVASARDDAEAMLQLQKYTLNDDTLNGGTPRAFDTSQAFCGAHPTNGASKFGGYCRYPGKIPAKDDDESKEKCFNPSLKNATEPWTPDDEMVLMLKNTVATQWRDGGCDYYRLAGSAPTDCPAGYHAGRGSDVTKYYPSTFTNKGWRVHCKIDKEYLTTKIKNCLECTSSTCAACKSCEEGYARVQWGSAKGTCFKCPEDNCATCSGQGYCRKCKKGFGLAGSIHSPRKCDTSQFLNHTTQEHEAWAKKTINNCLECKSSKCQACKTCEEGYSNRGGKCTKCTADNCATCGRAHICDECKKGFGLVGPLHDRPKRKCEKMQAFQTFQSFCGGTISSALGAKSYTHKQSQFGGYCRSKRKDLEMDECFNPSHTDSMLQYPTTVAIQFRDGGCDYLRLDGKKPTDCPHGYGAGQGTDQAGYRMQQKTHYNVHCKIYNVEDDEDDDLADALRDEMASR